MTNLIIPKMNDTAHYIILNGVLIRIPSNGGKWYELPYIA